MGRQIILKDDHIVVWSSIVDNFIFEGTIDEWIALSIQEETKKIKEQNIITYQKLQKGETAYYQFQKTYQEACEQRNLIHGKPDEENQSE